MKMLDWIMYFLTLAVSCFTMLHIGMGFRNWEYWVVCACVIIARVSGLHKSQVLKLNGGFMSNKLTQMALELLEIEKDIPFRLDYAENPRPVIDDFELYTFEQVWGSTALGFGGIGGQAMTSARTYVLIPMNCNQKCFVYFAGRYAYAVPYSQMLMDDVAAQNVAPVHKAGKYCMKG